MTCNHIYKTALALLGESYESPGCSDYLARTPYLLSIITARLAEQSRLIDGSTVGADELTLESDFPLAAPLAHCAAEMLASMLIFDEQPELADTLMKQAEADRKHIGSTTPVPDVGHTREVYGV